MAAPTETYVDPNIAGASGAGSIGDPYGDIQHALDTITRDGTNGDRINILAGTDEILGAALTLATYGTPAVEAPLIFQGYTSAAGDGGVGGISGAATYSIIASTTIDAVSFIDMHLHNTGSNVMVQTNDYWIFINCEFDNGGDGTNGALDMDRYGHVFNCYFHNISGPGVYGLYATIVQFSAFENGASDFTQAIYLNGGGGSAYYNVIDIDGSSDGILGGSDSMRIEFNSIYSTAGTGQGIDLTGNVQTAVITNNIVEGFSGVGGIGIQVQAAADVDIYGFNTFFNNTTASTLSGDIHVNLGNNQTLSGAGNSPFIDAANDDFRVKPSVAALAYPTANYPSLGVRSYTDMGALQRQSFPLVHPGYGGGLG